MKHKQHKRPLQHLNLNVNCDHLSDKNDKKELSVVASSNALRHKVVSSSTLPISRKRENNFKRLGTASGCGGSVVSQRNIHLGLLNENGCEKPKQNQIKSNCISTNRMVRSKCSDSVVSERPDRRSSMTLPLRNGVVSEEEITSCLVNGNCNESPSTDSNDSSLPLNYKKLETSASMPYDLSETAAITMRHSISTASMPSIAKENIHPLMATAANSSESMPNLTASPKRPSSPTSPLGSSSLSESDITSEQSGWVSSHRSSPEPSSGLISPTGNVLLYCVYY